MSIGTKEKTKEAKVRLFKMLVEQISRQCIDSLYIFMLEFWDVVSSDELVDNWHIKYLCYKLQERCQDVINKKPSKSDLFINIPPGMTKSTIVSVMLPVWIWLHKPDAAIISGSYSGDLSIDHSLKSKMVFQSPKFQRFFQKYFKEKFGEYITLTKNTEKDWRNNFGGLRYATSPGGTVTGKHADIIIRDDMMNPKIAASDAERRRVNEFDDRTLSNREKAKNKTLNLAIMQRLHEDDTTGHALKKEGIDIELIVLPAKIHGTTRATPKKLEKYYQDGYLDPVRLHQGVLDKQRAKLGSYSYAGQYDQKPYPDEEGIINRSWFCYMDKANIPKDLVWDLWIDGAYTENKEDNDPTGFMMAAWDIANDRMIVRHATSKWLTFPQVMNMIPEYFKENGGDITSTIYIEPKASGYDLINSIEDTLDIEVRKIKSKLVEQGKAVRVNFAAPKIERGKVWLVKDNWNDEFVTQMIAFPNYSHDEYCDLTGYALHEYVRR